MEKEIAEHFKVCNVLQFSCRMQFAVKCSCHCAVSPLMFISTTTTNYFVHKYGKKMASLRQTSLKMKRGNPWRRKKRLWNNPKESWILLWSDRVQKTQQWVWTSIIPSNVLRRYKQTFSLFSPYHMVYDTFYRKSNWPTSLWLGSSSSESIAGRSCVCVCVFVCLYLYLYV